MSPNAAGRGGGECGVLANKYSCAHRAQINFGDLTPYFTFAWFIKQRYDTDPDQTFFCDADPDPDPVIPS
jgi:hypothetical protein